MNTDIPHSRPVTLHDLVELKTELILELHRVFQKHNGQPHKKWLKTKEVSKILGVSITTLLTLRNNKVLPYTRMGGVLYYDYEDIQAVMDKLKNNPKGDKPNIHQLLGRP